VSDRARGRWTLAAAILGSAMAILDGTVVTVALPVIQQRLSTSLAGAQWVVESYLLFLSGLLLVGGALGDRFGRKRVFAAGAGLFGLASGVCGGAPSIAVLVAARAVQGVGAALLVPGSLALITAVFPASERGRAIGTWSGASALAAALGPVAGGFLVDRFSWRAVFFLNLPIAATVIAIAVLRMPEDHPRKASSLDAPGAVAAIFALGGLVFALIEASRAAPGSARVVVPAAIAAAAGVAFGFVEARSAHPMLPLGLFRSRAFAAVNVVTLFLYAALNAAVFFLPFNLIQSHGYSPTEAGAAILPVVLLVALLSRWAGRLGERIGPKIPLMAGPALAGAGFAIYPRTGGPPSAYFRTCLPPIALLGLGMAIAVAPLTTAVMSLEPERLAGVVSGINNSISRIGGMLAIAAFGIVVAAGSGGAPGRPPAASDAGLRAIAVGSAGLAFAAAAVAGFLMPGGRNLGRRG